MFKLAVAGLLLFVAASVGAAQETTGTVTGRVMDAQNLPIPGATVTVTGPQGSKTAVSDADGRYAVPFLTPGTYAVKAELQGFRSFERTGIAVPLGQSVAVPVTLTMGALSEVVQVTAAPPIIDATSTTSGASISSELLQRIPVGRTFSDTLYLAPGVSTGGSVGAANPSIAGGSGLDNQYVIDGVNVTNQGYGAIGSYSIVFGSLGNATPFDFLQEVQVKTGGYDAEFGQATGGLVNVVTKSGTNQVKGTVFGVRPSERPRSRLDAVPEHERQRPERSRPVRRRRDRRRRPDSQGPLVLLRRLRSVEDGDVLSGAGGVPSPQPRRRRPDPPQPDLRRQGDLEPGPVAADRRLVLRRSVDG